jgi:hypothetical protein
MIKWRLVIPAVLVAGALAVGVTYFVTPAPPRAAEAELPSALTAPDVTSSMADTPTIVGHRTAEEFERAAKEILKRLPDAQASARSDELPIVGHIPLPKRRPIPR